MRRASVFRRLGALQSSLINSSVESSAPTAVAICNGPTSALNNSSVSGIIPLFVIPRHSFSSLPPFTELAMPALSPTMSHGNLLEWKVTEGQEIAAGDLLAEVETDKATLGWENQDDGYVAKLLVPAGTKDIEVGKPVLILVDDADHVAAFKDYNQGSGASTSSVSASSSSSTTNQHISHDDDVEVNDRIGPAARTLLQAAGLSKSSVMPTGPNGIITKGDVLEAMKTGGRQASAPKTPAAATPPPAAAVETRKQQPPAAAASQSQQAPPSAPAGSSTTYTDIPTTQIRRIIAQRLLESKSTIPHLYLSADVSLDSIGHMREALKQQGTKVSVNDFVIKAVAMALRDVPAANAMWNSNAETVEPLASIDIAIAVATDTGLITPIVKNADQKSLSQISAEVRELAARARANKLLPEEFQGGSFSISNLGMFGVDSFSAIINPPQACIMAVGTGRSEAKLVNGKPVATTVMNVTLSADNRVFDGEIASSLLNVFSGYMANPFRLVTV